MSDGLRTTRENDALRRERPNISITGIPGMYLTEHTELAHPARDQLRVLRAEIEDKNPVGVNIAGSHGQRLTRSGSSALLW